MPQVPRCTICQQPVYTASDLYSKTDGHQFSHVKYTHVGCIPANPIADPAAGITPSRPSHRSVEEQRALALEAARKDATALLQFKTVFSHEDLIANVVTIIMTSYHRGAVDAYDQQAQMRHAGELGASGVLHNGA